MPVSEFLKAAGERTKAGQFGKLYGARGEIIVVEGAFVKGIDIHLWGLLKVMVDETRLAINISSGDGGQHVPNSRHYLGDAVDINKVGGANSVWMTASPGNQHAQKLVDWLRANGFVVGERNPLPALLWGPVGTPLNPSTVDHSTHIHMSIPTVRKKRG